MNPNQEPVGPGSEKRGNHRSRASMALAQGSLSDPFILRPVMTMLLVLSAIVFGIVTFQLLPVNDLPAVDYPVIQVQVSYPGANPTTMANNVATPLEKQFLQIPGLALVTSTSTQSNTSLTLQFDLSKTIDSAATDVQAAIQRATGQLPKDLPSPPTFTKTNPNDQSVYLFALTSDTMTDGDLYKYANSQVAQQITILPGVSTANVYGVQGALRIKVNPDALSARGLTMTDLASAIQANTSYAGAGQFDGPYLTFVLQPNGQLDTVEGYKNIIITRGKDNAPLYLKDVAEVVQTVVDERLTRNFWVRGHTVPGSVVVIAVFRQAGANAVAVADSVKKLLPILRQTVPPSIQILEVFDRSQTIVSSVEDVEATLFIAFLLVVLVIYLFLGRVTDTIIPVVALPLSILLTFIVIYMFGYSVNNLTLLALTLAIGFLVDDAIVFLENVVRHTEAGMPALQATFLSAKEISFTIFSMTLSLAAVFIPLVLLPGLLGRIFREFAITIVVAIFASGAVSLTVTPLMCSRVLAGRGRGHKETWIEYHVGRFIKRVIQSYGHALDWFLARSWLTIPILIGCVLGVYLLFHSLSFTLLPAGDSGFIQGIFLTQEGTSPDQMHRYQKQVDEALKANPAVGQTFTLSGFSSRTASNQGLIFCFLKPVSERPSIDVCLAQLTKAISQIPGVIPFLRPNPVLQISLGATNQNQGRYAYVLSGINPEAVYSAAEQLVVKMNQHPGFVKPVASNYFHNTPNLQINIQRPQASTFGVYTAGIESILRNAYAQNYVYLIKEPDDQYQVIMEVDDKNRQAPNDLRNLYVRSTLDQKMVPFSGVTQWAETTGFQSVNHYNQFPSVTINFNLNPGVAEGDAIDFINKEAREILLPTPTVSGKFQGETLVLQTLVKAFPVLFLAAIFTMYVILGILYESYIHPITVLSTLIPAVIGGLFTLWIFGAPLSLYSIIGLFMLIGIVKKNGIMIVDFALQRLDEGYDRHAAIHEASMERFRPIMMTTLAALMGAVPLALGFGADGSSRRPLGLVIVGGLIFSQLITLFITPVIYLWLETFQERVLDKVPFLRSTHTHHELETQQS